MACYMASLVPYIAEIFEIRGDCEGVQVLWTSCISLFVYKDSLNNKNRNSLPTSLKASNKAGMQPLKMAMAMAIGHANVVA